MRTHSLNPGIPGSGHLACRLLLRASQRLWPRFGAADAESLLRRDKHYLRCPRHHDATDMRESVRA